MDALGIIRQLEDDVALRAQLRAVLLGDELLELPGLSRQMHASLEALVQAQVRTEERLVQFQDAAEQRFRALESEVGTLKGMTFEARVQMNPRRFVPRQLARGARKLDDERFDRLLDALDTAHATDVELADALIEARIDGTDVVLVVEVAWMAHVDDVQRAARRAAALRPAGVDARALVVSHAEPTSAVVSAAAEHGVSVVSEPSGLLTPHQRGRERS